MRRERSGIAILPSKTNDRADSDETERPDSVSTWKRFCQSGLERASDQRGFFRGNRERRREKDVIAAEAIDAALHRIGKHTFVETSLANSLGDVSFPRERFVSSFVFDEFDAAEKAQAANIADVRVRLKQRKSVAQIFCGGSHAIKELVRFEVVENSVARGGTNWMRLVSEAVHEGARAVLECFDDAGGNENRSERGVTAGDSLTDQNHVRLDVPVLHSKRFSGAAHAGHNFVRDEENSVLAADFRNARDVAFRRHCGTESGTDDRLEDEGCGLTGFVFEQMDFEIVGAREVALRKSFVERAVVAETRRNVSPFREERLVGCAARDVSADGHRAKSAAVITLAAGENAVALLLAAFEVKLAR